MPSAYLFEDFRKSILLSGVGRLADVEGASRRPKETPAYSTAPELLKRLQSHADPPGGTRYSTAGRMPAAIQFSKRYQLSRWWGS
jgi:hypothetical protein